MTEGKIEVKINEKGEIAVETHGILGPACLDEVNKLLENIAAITSVNKTDEYYMKGNVSIQRSVKQEVKR